MDTNETSRLQKAMRRAVYERETLTELDERDAELGRSMRDHPSNWEPGKESGSRQVRPFSLVRLHQGGGVLFHPPL